MNYEKLPKTISAEELLSTPLPPVKWIIPGLLPAGLALFAGPSKAGKSWLTLWLCLQIAQGNPVWNREIEPRTVIYFSLEDTFNRLQSRIFQLIDGGDAPERLILQTECPSIGQGLEEQIDSLIYTYSDVGMIVIDTLQKVRVSDGNGGMYANDYKEAGALKKLADKYGICILLIHHLRKQTASDPFDQISGSTGLMGVADTSWVMQRKRMSQTADILLTGRDMDDRTLHLREENCIWTLEDEETAEEREIKAVPDYLWKAAKYIESVGNWQGTASELLAAAGIENAKPNQFTYNMAKYFDKVFEPKNIRYKTHRKNKVRLLNFYGDDGDGGEPLRVDLDIGIVHRVLLQRLEQAPAQRVAAYHGDQGHRKAKTAKAARHIGGRTTGKRVESAGKRAVNGDKIHQRLTERDHRIFFHIIPPPNAISAAN